MLQLTQTEIIDGLVLLVTGIGVISFWRGIWNLQDHILPKHPVVSNLLSFVFGLALVTLMYVFFPEVFGQ